MSDENINNEKEVDTNMSEIVKKDYNYYFINYYFCYKIILLIFIETRFYYSYFFLIAFIFSTILFPFGPKFLQ